MRVGDSPPYIEAAYALQGPLPAGRWGVVGDGIIAGDMANAITVRFEVRWRPKGTAGASDQVVVSVENEFLRDPNNRFNAVAFDTTLNGQAVAAAAGDLLVLRATAVRGDAGAIYIINGDGSTTKGRIPRIDLPPLPQSQ